MDGHPLLTGPAGPRVPGAGCWCFSTRENIQAHAVCSQRLWVALINGVPSKASAMS